MANLYFKDEDGTIKTIANIDSPIFTGVPTLESRDNFHDRDILNVEDAIRYIDNAVSNFNDSRLISVNSNTMTGLIGGKKYLISVYGEFSTGDSNTYSIGPVVIKNNDNEVLKASGTIVKNVLNPKCVIPQSATLILDSAPSDGTIIGLLNYNHDTDIGIEASYMTAIRLS